MKKMNKNVELSCKALGAAIFMGIVCLHMGIEALFALISGNNFNYHISFAFLIHGIVISMPASAAWVLCFGSAKPWSFFTRYLLALTVLVALFTITILIPAINSTEGHFTWVVSGIISTFSFGTAIAVFSNKHFRKTGIRSTLIWEIK